MVVLMLCLLIAISLYFAVFYVKDFRENKDNAKAGNVKKGFFIGLATDFFDAIGVGSFATTTAIFKLNKSLNVSDKLVPGTLNVAHALPVVTQALLTMTVIEVDILTLILMIASAVIGSWVGAGVISKLPEKKIQVTMGIALIITAILICLGQVGLMPSGGDSIGLEGSKLIIGIIGNFILGALMTAGVGLYAPCMAMVALLGMNPKMAFPIMMGACAFLTPIASVKFIKEEAYEREVSMGITLGGIIGSAIAILFVSNLPVSLLKWLVMLVCLYTAISMLKSASSRK